MSASSVAAVSLVKKYWKPIAIVLFISHFGFLWVPFLFVMFLTPSAGPDNIEIYKRVGEEANLSWVDMVILDTVRKENNFEGLDADTIDSTALDFWDLEISKYEKELTCSKSESDDTIDPKTKKVTSKGHSHGGGCYSFELQYTSHSAGDSIRSKLDSLGYSSYTLSQIIDSIEELDSEELYSARINYKNLDDLLIPFDQDKREWATMLLSSNMILNMYGEYIELPDHIDVVDGGFFAYPVPTLHVITSPFGNRIDPITKKSSYHSGVDISGANATGQPIIASADGKVLISVYSRTAGNFVKMQHIDPDGNVWYTRYLHMSQLNVSEGDEVMQGDVIGAVGNTGRSTGPHLHFEMYYGNQIVDPFSYISVK